MSGDAIGAAVLFVLAALLIVWGIRKALQEDSVQPPASPREPAMSEREKRYHSSNQFGR